MSSTLTRLLFLLVVRMTRTARTVCDTAFVKADVFVSFKLYDDDSMIASGIIDRFHNHTMSRIGR